MDTLTDAEQERAQTTLNALTKVYLAKARRDTLTAAGAIMSENDDPQTFLNQVGEVYAMAMVLAGINYFADCTSQDHAVVLLEQLAGNLKASMVEGEG